MARVIETIVDVIPATSLTKEESENRKGDTSATRRRSRDSRFSLSSTTLLAPQVAERVFNTDSLPITRKSGYDPKVMAKPRAFR